GMGISSQALAEAVCTVGLGTVGDGVADTFGADAVRRMYEADVSGVGMFVWQVGMDPLTYIPLVSTGGGRLANIGRARVANATSRTGVVGGRSIEILGRVIQRGSQALDEATSFGAGILLDRVAMPIGRRVGKIGRAH